MRSSFNTNPYIAEAVNVLSRTLFFYLVTGLCGLMFALMHEILLGSVLWLFILATVAIHRIQKFRQIERSSFSEEEAAPVFARILYFSGTLPSFYCLLFLDKFDQTLFAVVSISAMLLVVSGPIIAPSFIFLKRKIELGIYFLLNVGFMSYSWHKADYPFAELFTLGGGFVCAFSYIKIISNHSDFNGIDMLSMERAISTKKVEKEIAAAQLQVAQLSHNIRQTVQALNFQLEDAGGDRESLRRQLKVMDKFLVRLQNMGQSNGGSDPSELKACTEIGDLVGDAFEIFKTLALKQGIQFSKFGAPLYVQISPEELYFVLCNLMSNTIRHSKGSMATVSWTDVGDFVEISYRDNGVGFPLYQSLEVENIGSRKFGVESIEATLSARGIHYFWEWDQRPGMKFSFFAKRIPRASMQRGSFCILIEDDLMTGEWMSRIIAKKFERVIVLKSLEEAIISSHEHRCLPNLIITDLSIGENSWKRMSTLQFVQRLQIIFECPVLVVTGDISVCKRSCGATRVMHKPIDRSELTQVIDSILNDNHALTNSGSKDVSAA